MNGLTKAAQDVLTERERQITEEGWTPEHDDEHGDGSMAKAAACYALGMGGVSGTREFVSFWPWDAKSRKFSRDPRRNLVKAGALILAEIERLDRANGVAAVAPATSDKRVPGCNYGNKCPWTSGDPSYCRACGLKAQGSGQ